MLEVKQWSGANVENISFTLAMGESLALLGGMGKKELFQGILGIKSGKQGEILLHAEKPRCSMVLTSASHPLGISPKEIGRIFAPFHENWENNTFLCYLSALNLSPELPLPSPFDAYKSALACALTAKHELILVEIPNMEKNTEDWNRILRDCSRVLNRETATKIFLAPDLETLEKSGFTVEKFAIIGEKNLLFLGEKEEIMENLMEFTCNISRFTQISGAEILWKEALGEEIRFWCKNSEDWLKNFPDIKVDELEFRQVCQRFQEEIKDDPE